MLEHEALLELATPRWLETGGAAFSLYRAVQRVKGVDVGVGDVRVQDPLGSVPVVNVPGGDAGTESFRITLPATAASRVAIFLGRTGAGVAPPAVAIALDDAGPAPDIARRPGLLVVAASGLEGKTLRFVRTAPGGPFGIRAAAALP